MAERQQSAKQADAFSVFFLQRLHEALFDYSADSFKAPALNSHLRVLELRRIGAQSEASDYLTNSVESFFDELSWSLSNDPVLKGPRKELARDFLTRARAGWGKPSQFTPAVQALELQFADYLELLTAGLLEEASAENWSKERVVHLLDALIVELETSGYPRSNIYSVAQRINVRKRQGKLWKGPKHTVELFLKHFGGVRRRYVCYLYTSGRLARRLITFPRWSLVSDEQRLALETIAGWQDFSDEAHRAGWDALVAFETQERCSQAASREASANADRISDLVNFVDHHASLSAFDKLFCVESSLKIGTVCPKRPSTLRFVGKTSDEETSDAVDSIREFFTKSRLNDQAKLRLIRAFEYHAAALAARRPEDQLLNLWSSLEGFVGVPSSAGSKISYVREAVLSALTLLYPQRLFSLTANRIHEVLGDGLASRIFAPAEAHAPDTCERLAVILISPGLANTRQELASEIASREPVLLFRLFQLFERFKSASDTKATLTRHREKVAWQLNRIYWNRNLIVHSAQSLPYLAVLVEHLHTYIDSFLQSIMVVAAREGAQTISATLELIGAHERHRLHELDRALGSSPIEVRNWVFGELNLLRSLDGI